MGILTLFILIPLLTLAALLPLKKPANIKAIVRTGIGLQVILSFVLTGLYLAESSGKTAGEMLFVKDILWIKSLNIHYMLGADGITVLMLLLTSLVAFATLLPAMLREQLTKQVYVSFLLVVCASSGFLVSIDLVLVFVFFAALMIPLFFIQGSSSESVQKNSDVMRLILIPAGGAAILLIGILGIYMNSAPDGNSLTFNLLEINKYIIPPGAQRVFLPMVILGFIVIGALLPFSIWLPESFTRVPIQVPQFYSGVLMKLGAYGIFRYGISLMPEGAREMSLFFLALAAVTVIYGAVGTIMQKDLRKMHAYSSISFSGLIFFALLLMNENALKGAFLMIFSHGLMIALLFSLTGMIHDRTQSVIVKNLTDSRIPLPKILSLFYVVSALALSGVPGSAGFIAVKTIFTGIMQESEPVQRISGLIILVLMVLMLVYILVMSVKMLTASMKESKSMGYAKVMVSEKITIASLLIPVVIAGILPAWIISLINSGLQPALTRIIEISPF